MAKKGQIFGNQNTGSIVRVTNGMAFSYPGYNEMLTGHPDPRFNSNEFDANPNTTVWRGRGLGHGMSETICLTFHKDKCYDIESRTTETSFANLGPGTIKEFTEYARVDREFEAQLNSFRFLK